MPVISKYKLSLSLLVFFGVLVCSFYWTRVPMTGFKTSAASSMPLRFGYFNQQEGEIGDSIKQFRDISYFVASHRLLQRNPGAQAFQIYPIYDGSATEEHFSQAYPQVPTGTLPGYGKSVYATSHGNARMFFLNADRLPDAGDRQLEWIGRTVDEKKQLFNFVWLSKDPKLPEVWNAFRAAGINAVFIRDSVYVLQLAVTQQSSGYRPAEYEGWGVWDLTKLKEMPFITVLEAVDNTLVIKAENKQGIVLDQLKQDAQNLASWNLTTMKEKQEVPLVGIQSLWRYHPGSEAIKSALPEGGDLVGEGPVIETSHTEIVPLPAYDWRSPEYDDSAWELGRGPLGNTNNRDRQTYVQTDLEGSKSPTYYFRKSFDLDIDPKELSDLYVNIAYEDGYVVYLNGQEVSRDAILSGILTESSLAFPNEFSFYRRIDLKAHLNKLAKGANVIAVEVHRSHPSSPNLFFDLALSVESE
ncbi:hypothetical protein [Paenibacillus sacheonensis]|uniref:PA14 domain-containing protein n=1 Tax=Paenibacillus sacheonensis TaxID=742054 RepID=A0A7X4YS78_9BACL|nr:hypothetical protein [Paenibacillus sacheonensis]MBM7566980.1 hypothetical protein [Paenibacillus sacheonensis]NBC71602.1 hypothetical protein [Paenibacillus sacheonensis]